MRRSGFLVVVGVAALFLGACGNDTSSSGEGGSGGGDRNGDEQAYVDEMTAAIQQSSGEDEAIPKDQAECWMGDMADGIGVDTMKEAGFTPEAIASQDEDNEVDLKSLSEDDRKVVATSFTECIDLEQAFMKSLASSGEEVPKAMKECFEGIDWEVLEEKFSEMILTGDEMDENDSAMAPLLGCMLGSMGDMGDMGDMDTSTTVG